MTAKIPLVTQFACRRRTLQIKRSRTLKWDYFYALFHSRDIHSPIAGVGQGMEVAIIHERFQFHFDGTVSAHEGVLNEGGVFTMAHPDALFQKRVGKPVSPNGRRAFQMKILQEQKALWLDGAAGPTMGGKGKIGSGVVDDFVDARDQLCASHGRLQCSYQESM